jgi:hypothetical protein
VLLTCYYINNKPFIENKINKIEIFNEICLYFICVAYLLFTDYENDYNAKWSIGFACIFFIVINFIVNVILLLKGSI